jgi:hypothetical protein
MTAALAAALATAGTYTGTICKKSEGEEDGVD